MKDFLADWRETFGRVPPLSYALPKNNRWVRFHALPMSKRYPDTPAETAIVTHRANMLGQVTLGDDSCWFVQTIPDDDYAASASMLEPDMECVGSAREDEVLWHAFAKQARFVIGEADDLIRRIALETAPRTLWFAPVRGRAFAPYDGGFDIFCETSEVALELKRRHSHWLSTRADGL